MVNAYLWLNALLYIALALWCTLAPESTVHMAKLLTYFCL